VAGAIDTAYVEFEARTENLERGALVAFDEVASVGRRVTAAIDRSFEVMTDHIIEQFQQMRVEADDNFDGLLTGVERVGAEIATSIAHGTETAERGFDELALRAREDLGSVGASAGRVGTEVGGMTSRMSTAISTMAGFVGGNIVMNGLSQAYQFAKSSVIGFNSTLQNSGIAFTTMLGSAQKAQTFVAQLQAFAKATPFEFQGLVQNAQNMMGMGIAAKDVIPDLTALGDSVASVGGSAEQVNQVTLAFDQMAAKGTLDMGNMNQLLQGGVPNALRILADSYKVTTGQMIEMISTGKIQSADALPRLIDGIEHGTKSVAALGGMMDKQSRTMTGALSNIKDGLQQAIAGAFRPFFDVVASGAVKLGNFFSSNAFATWANGVSSAMSRVIDLIKYTVNWMLGIRPDALTGWSAGAINEINSVEANLAKIADDVHTVFDRVKSVIVKDVIPAARSLINTFGPVLVGVVIASVHAFTELSSVLGPLGAFIKNVFGFMEEHKTVFQAVAVSIITVVAAMKAYSLAAAIVETATKVWTAAQILLDVAMDANPVGLIVLAILALAAGIFYLWTHSEGFRKFFINAWADIWGTLKAIGAWFAGPFVNFFVSAWHFITALPGKVMAELRALPGQLVNIFMTGLNRVLYDVGFFVGAVIRFFINLPPRLLQLLTQMWNQILYDVGFFIGSMIRAMIELPPRIWQVLTELWDGAGRLTQRGVNWVVNYVSALPGRVGAFFSSLWSTVVNLSQGMWNAVVSFAQALPGRLWSAIAGIPGMVWNTLSGLGSMLWNIGSNMVQSLISGVTHLLGWAVNAARNAALSIAHGFMDGLGIGSPSKVFIDIGKYTVQGYVHGIEGEIDTAHTAMKQIITPAQGVTSTSTNTATNTIHHGFSGTVVVNVGGRQVEGAIVDILYDNPQHVALASRQGDRRLARR